MKITVIDGGVTSPKGFKAAGLRAGIKPGKTNKDMAMIYSEVPATLAGTFTKNRVMAAPVQWDKKIVEYGKVAQAVVVNTGVANAATGEQGYLNAKATAEEAGKTLGIPTETVLVASTGVIGFQLPMNVILSGVKSLVPVLSDSREAALRAAEAILTTDTHKKEIAVSFLIGGTLCTLAGMSKGSGMIHPNMGTMLCFITTDADIDQKLLQDMLREVVDETYNMVSVDGDTSTNDTVLVLANGKAGAPKIGATLFENDTIELLFSQGLGKEVLYQLAFDAEGTTYTGRQRLLPIPQPKDVQWKAQGHVFRAKTSATGWTAELFVPFSVFEDGAPKAYDNWNFNCAVTHRACSPDVSASTSLTGPAHANLDMFGIIRFDGKGD